MIERHNLVFLHLDSPTLSGRIYPKAVVQQALSKYQQSVSQNRAVGCFVEDIHPLTSAVNLTDVTHRIIDVKIIGSNLIGAIATLPTTKGKFLESIIDRPDLHFDTRGSGNVNNGVVSNFTIMSIDVYFKPGLTKPASDPVSDYDRAMGIIKK